MRRSALLPALLASSTALALAACGDSGREDNSNTAATPTAGSITAGGTGSGSGSATDAPTSAATDTAATAQPTGDTGDATGPATNTTNTPKFDLGGDPGTGTLGTTGAADDGCTKI
ncbi:MAG: hypothetical protein JNK56_36295, partial [Myxococcales bacterium]|nr:hypothetical protein [Myxococcales bacterium]